MAIELPNADPEASYPTDPTKLLKAEGTTWQEAFEIYVSDRYKEKVTWYDNRANRNHRQFNTYQVLILAGSAAVTVESALLPASYRWVIIVSSSFVTLLVGLLNHFKYQEKWVRHRGFGQRLISEQYYMAFRVGEYEGLSDKQAARTFVERVEELIASEQRDWGERHVGEVKIEAPSPQTSLPSTEPPPQTSPPATEPRP